MRSYLCKDKDFLDLAWDHYVGDSYNPAECYLECRLNQIEEAVIGVINELFGKGKLDATKVALLLVDVCQSLKIEEPDIESINIERPRKIESISKFSSEDLFKDAINNLKVIGA